MADSTLAEAQALLNSGAWKEAEQVVLRFLQSEPADIDALHMLGLACAGRGENHAAVSCLSEALARDPARADIARNLTALYIAAGRDYDAAVLIASRPAEESGEDTARVWQPLVEKRLTELRANPAAAAEAATRLRECGAIHAALDAFRLALDSPSASTRQLHAGYLYTLLHLPGISAEELLLEHQKWAVRHASPARKPARSPNLPADRKLRIGYLGGDFRCGPALYLSLPVLQNHSRDRFEIFLYDGSEKSDACSETFRNAADVWRDCRGLEANAVADLVAADRIDTLVEVSGHFGDTLHIVGTHPASCTLFFPKYPCTSGLAAMDAYLTDDLLSPAGVEHTYTERLLRIPGGALLYGPPAYSPPVGPQPCEANGFVTFGLFQRRLKYHPEFWDAVGRILGLTRDSRILLHSGDSACDPMQVAAPLLARGITPERIAFAGSCSSREHLELVSSVDISLDTWPYNGQTTTMESLWMGVPVVALEGNTHVSRVASTILKRLHCPELVASTVPEYVQIAARLAADPEALVDYRSSLRARMSDRMANPAQFTHALEQSFLSLYSTQTSLTAVTE